MQQPLSFKNIAESGIFQNTELETSGAVDLLVAIEADEPGSLTQIRDMATLLGVTEEQMNQIEVLYDMDGSSNSITTQQLLALQQVVGFELTEEQITVLSALERLPKGEDFSFEAL